MPVLARTIEEAGIPTVVVTMIPDLAEKYRLSRIVGVEFPFGHAYGMPNEREMQHTVAGTAIDLLGSAEGPGARADVDLEWPVDVKTAYRDWQPSEPSPMVAHNIARRQRIEEQRAARS